MSIAELERLWEASPAEAPPLLPAAAWERLAAGDAVGAVMMREGSGGELSLVVALPSLLVYAIEHASEPALGASEGGGIVVSLTFGSDIDWSVELTAHDMCVPTTARRLAVQESLPVAWIDVDEQVVVAHTRRGLDDARPMLAGLGARFAG